MTRVIPVGCSHINLVGLGSGTSQRVTLTAQHQLTGTLDTAPVTL